MLSPCTAPTNYCYGLLNKEYLTDSLKIKLQSVNIFTYGYSLKFHKICPKIDKYVEKQITTFFMNTV